MLVALYNKYRPKNFQETIGQEVAKNILINNILETPFHAFIFHGPRGTGKTSVARIFSKSTKCKNFHLKNDLCEECSHYFKHQDILEISAASCRGIDDMKEIFSFSSFLPFDAKKKVIIFDEAHMLTKESFAFLLKNIEECFQHIIYIFVTTNLEKIPITIISRCQKIPFFIPNEEEIEKLGNHVIKKEGINISKDVFKAFLNKSKRIPRELLVLLEETKFFDINHLEKLINHETEENFKFIYNNLMEKNISSIEEFIDKKFLLSIEWKSFIVSFLDFLCKKHYNNVKRIVSNFYSKFLNMNDIFFSRSFILFIFWNMIND